MANQFSAEQQQKLVSGISQALQQGISPQEIIQTLVKMGIPQDQAVGVLQQIMQQMQGEAGQEQMAQQQAAMRYGGIPRAAMGMQMSPEFGTGMIQTMPNVQSYPSYNAYRTAYDQYIDQLGSAMQTTIPDLSGMNVEDNGTNLDVITKEEYDRLIQENPELARSMPPPVIDSTLEAAVSTAVKDMEPESEVKELIEKKEKPEASSGWSPLSIAGAVAVGGVGAGIVGYGGYKAYKALQRKFGKVPEVDLSNLTPREREAFMKTVDAVKARISQQGYYTKQDINDLVINGIPRQEAEAFVEGMLTKKEKKAATRKANTPSATPSPDNSANAAAAKQKFLDEAKLEVDSWASNFSRIINDPNAGAAEKALAKQYFDDPIKFFKGKVAANPSDQLYIDALAQHEVAIAEGFNPMMAPVVGPVYPAGYRVAPSVVTPEQLGQTKQYLQAKKQAKTGNTAALDAINAAREIAGNQVKLVIPGTSYAPKGGKPSTPSGRKFERQKMRGRVVEIPTNIQEIITGGKGGKTKVKINYGKMKRNPKIKLEDGGQYSGTYSAGVYYGMGGYVPEYAASAYGVQDLPQFRMGSYYDDDTYAYMPSQEELAAAQMMYGNPFAPSPLSKFVYPQTYADGGAAMGMSPEEQQMMMMQEQAAQQEMPQQGGGGQEEQIIQAVAQMLQQGAQPEQIMQQLVQAGVPQEMAMQVIQMVMQQMQGAQQMAPEQGAPIPMQKYGGSKKKKSMVGREMDVTPQQMEELRRKGVKFEII